MKVALCISGHLRGISKTIQNQLSNLIEPNDCEVFVYTSNLISQRVNLDPEFEPSGNIFKKYNAKGHMSGIMYNVDKKEIEKQVSQSYNTRLVKLVVDDERLEENLKVGYKESDKYFSGSNRKPWGWIKKTFEKTYKCDRMFTEFCNNNELQYDIVIRSRTDLSFKDKLLVNNMDINDKIFAFGGWNPGGTHQTNGYNEYYFDGFAYSTPNNISRYCRFYTDASENFKKATGLEPQLHDYLEKAGLQYASIGNTTKKSQRQYKIVR
tara:strand:+ start:4114 stop:4911 length:798 start_codon:yes stop_codon:yes gene_type:complete